jgi:hypothetical protein
MSGSCVLGGAFASLARGDGIALYCSADALRNLASIIRDAAPTDVGLTMPPEDVVEEAPLRAIRVLSGDADPIDLRVAGDAIEIEGGSSALAKLAQTLENLADAPAFGAEVLRHVDLEYFPGHGFLGAASTWMTVILLPTPDA